MKTLGLRHVALYVQALEACEHFYVQLLKMRIVWRPDPDNLYLEANGDNLALHRGKLDVTLAPYQRLDHIGFFLATPAEVDAWHAYFVKENVPIKAPPKDHRDGTRSFYCLDPDGTTVQMIFCPEKLDIPA